MVEPAGRPPTARSTVTFTCLERRPELDALRASSERHAIPTRVWSAHAFDRVSGLFGYILPGREVVRLTLLCFCRSTLAIWFGVIAQSVLMLLRP
jgi:hypothetical protein